MSKLENSAAIDLISELRADLTKARRMVGEFERMGAKEWETTERLRIPLIEANIEAVEDQIKNQKFNY